MREQDLYQDMLPYRTGTDLEGNSSFSIPLETDEDGMLGRECPCEECTPSYFKIHVSDDEGEDGEDSSTDTMLTCPYCGKQDSFQEYHTQGQIDWASSLLLRDVEQGITRQLKKAFAPLNRRQDGFLNLRVDVTAGSLPPLLKYVEEQLKQVCYCDSCSCEYAVYGISYHCPLCGEGALLSHIRGSVETIRVLASEAEAIGQKHGLPARDRMLGNAAEDVVGVFEGFLKQIYRYAVQKKYSQEEAERLQKKVRTNFQRVNGAEEVFLRDLSVELLNGISDAERGELGMLFSKRHVLTHNLGLIDAKYQEQVQPWEKEGQEVPLEGTEIDKVLAVVERILTTVAGAAL